MPITYKTINIGDKLLETATTIHTHTHIFFYLAYSLILIKS